MSVLAILYVSTASILEDRREAALERIVEQATSANTRAGLTGALMFSGNRFAQMLEGPSNALDALMERIAADPRHCEVTILFHGAVAKCQFKSFSLVYSGSSVFVSRSISLPLARAKRGAPPELENLIRLMVEFSR